MRTGIPAKGETPSVATTTNLGFASALLALGFELKKKPMKISDGKKTVYSFHFTDRNESGGNNLSFSDMAAAWRDGRKWVAKNPEHPMAYLICAYDNRNWLLDNLKKFTRIALVRDGDKLRFVPVDADQETKDAILSI